MIHMQEEARDAGVEIPENFEVFKSLQIMLNVYKNKRKNVFVHKIV